MEVTAYAKNIRMSPQKVRLVADKIKKMKPQEAIATLGFIEKASASFLKKVILSAIANAKNNHNLAEETLSFKEIHVTKGQVFKRYRAIARGRPHSILKRTSHIKVILQGEKQQAEQKTQAPENKSKTEKSTERPGRKNGTKS